jgi:hypothetical protein
MHHHVEEMIRTHPSSAKMDVDGRLTCIETCLDCEQACTGCADACIAEDHLALLMRCIRIDQDCADLCAATARILSRSNEPDWVVIRETLQACLAACRSCGTECRRHTEMQHCQVCADACDACANACQALLDANKAG